MAQGAAEGIVTGIGEGLASIGNQIRANRQQQVLDRDGQADQLTEQIKSIADNIARMGGKDTPEAAPLVQQLNETVQKHNALFPAHESGALIQRIQKLMGHKPGAPREDPRADVTAEGAMAAAPMKAPVPNDILVKVNNLRATMKANGAPDEEISKAITNYLANEFHTNPTDADWKASEGEAGKPYKGEDGKIYQNQINKAGQTRAVELKGMQDPADTKQNDPAKVAEYKFYSQQETAAGKTPLSFNEWNRQAGPPTTPNPPSAVAEYTFYAKQETDAGRKPLTFDQWQTREANRRAVPTQNVVINSVDEEGNKKIRIVPKVAGGEYAAAPTAQEQNRRDQADIVQRQVDHVISLIDAHPENVGPILGRLARGETVLGVVSPESKALATALGSLVALQPILHGYRGGSQTTDHFQAVIGDQKLNAAALKASLNEIKALASDIRTGGSEPVGGGTVTPQQSDSVKVQIPGHPVGIIPASALQQFLRDNPGATRVK